MIKYIDVLEGLKQLSDESIDCIVTSPPYNKYGLSKFKHRKIKYKNYDDNMFEEDYQNWQIEILNECHRVYQTIIWNRNQSPSIFNTFLMPTYEYVFWMTKTQKTPKVYRNRLDNIKDIWNITPSRSKIHPATFPVKLVENCILLTTDEGDLVLDIFAGTGTTLNVADKLNRESIGFDKIKY